MSKLPITRPAFLAAFALVSINAAVCIAGEEPENLADPNTEMEVVEPLGLPAAPAARPPAEALERGASALNARDYETAFAEYRAAADALPDNSENSQLRGVALEGFTNAALGLAEQRIAEGRWQDAEEVVRTLLKEEYSPDSAKAKELLSHLEDPEYFNKTITPGFVSRVEEVKRLLAESNGFFDSGRYDEAHSAYQRVLQIDPYNLAAWKGVERVNEMKARAMEAAEKARRPLRGSPIPCNDLNSWLPLFLITLPAVVCAAVLLFGRPRAASESASTLVNAFAHLLAVALLAYVLMAVMLRYEVVFPRNGDGTAMMRLDRWTGKVERLPAAQMGSIRESVGTSTLPKPLLE